MVAAWGGYIFVINMVGLHAALLAALGRFNSGVHKAYSIFYIVGTAGAMQVPVVGLQPLRSVEQLGPLMVFVGYQVLAFCDWQRRRRQMAAFDFAVFRIKVMAALVVVTALVCAALYPTGYFGPISSRIRGLFVKHTKTGNPLVDSVAEHQPASPSMYASYLNLPLDYVVLGGLVSLWHRNNGFLLLCLYGFVAQHFSGKMSRQRLGKTSVLDRDDRVVSRRDKRTGQNFIVDDYLKGYQWIDENTPKDSRVMAWWDYGYQITGIAKRTSIADGNTWNHEHIATLGRTLTSSEKKAHNAIRHLADYVLVWAGGGGDDLAKSPHLARIGNSVFPDHCGDDDPKCNKFSFYSDYSPTPMMARSLLYKLCQHKVSPGVSVNEKLFKEVHTTKHGLMRIYKVMNVSQESKDWVEASEGLPWCLVVAPVCVAGSASSASSGEARAEARAVSKQTLGIFSHLALTLRLLWSKWSKSKRSRRNLTPLPRSFPWRFRQDLRRKGCGVVRIPSAAVEPLQRIAQEYLTREFPQFSPKTAKPKLRGQGRKSVESIEAQGTATESTESTGSFFRADGLNAAFPSSMSWHWASDAATLEVFAKAGQHVLRFLGDDFALVAASLVVASGDCMDDLSKFHLDFGPPKIPRGVAATALMPLWPDRFPSEGHLAPWLEEIRPWDANEMVTYHYQAGRAVVFDGKLAHRTQPFRIQSFAGTSLRVLASMSFAWLPSHAPWKSAVNQVADPKNRICDAPGSWYCVGQYPPALEKLIAKRRNFAQIEDFNKQGGKSVLASTASTSR
ncbi:unnamed protein product [Cladocopium goreaui]|uniref:dolichyl-diphosphooligosaccharide--protein glycotransferase n=1 Tax=Cladocopium goreaui TaxID=2562237 RepID=A0A9P1GFW9_9DINO|nr:unnamed protein product [Cladocopium goreaui]